MVQIPEESRGFVLSQLAQTISGTHTSYFPFFEGDHTTPSSAKTIKNGLYLHFLLFLHSVCRDSLTVTYRYSITLRRQAMYL